MANDVGTLTVDQMVLRSIDQRLKRIEKALGTLPEMQAELEAIADDIEEIKTVMGLLSDDEEQE